MMFLEKDGLRAQGYQKMEVSEAKLLQQSSSLRETKLESKSLFESYQCCINCNVGKVGEMWNKQEEEEALQNRRLLWFQNK